MDTELYPISSSQLVRLIEERGYFDRSTDPKIKAALTGNPEAAEKLRVARESLAEHIMHEAIGVNQDDPDSIDYFKRMRKVNPYTRKKEGHLSSNDNEECYEQQREIYIEDVTSALNAKEALAACITEQFDEDEATLRSCLNSVALGRIKPREVCGKKLVRWNEKEHIEPEIIDDTISTLRALLANPKVLAGRGAGLDKDINDFLDAVTTLKPPADPHTPPNHNGNGKLNIFTMDGEELLDTAIDDSDKPMHIGSKITSAKQLEALRGVRTDLAESMIMTFQTAAEKLTKKDVATVRQLVSKTLPLPPKFGVGDEDCDIEYVRKFNDAIPHAHRNYAGVLELAGVDSDTATRQFCHDYKHLRHTMKEIIGGTIKEHHGVNRKMLDPDSLDTLVDRVAMLRTSGHLPDSATGTADKLIEKLPGVRPTLARLAAGHDRK